MPLTLVNSTISPFVDTKSLFFTHYVLACISSTVSPIISTATMHLILVPVSLKSPSVGPSVITEALYISIIPDSVIARPIMPLVHSCAMFLTHHIFSIVFWTILPSFCTVAMLLIIEPLTIVGLATARLHIYTLSMSFSTAILAFISSTIRPRLLAISMFQIIIPGPNICRPAIPSIWCSMFQQLRINFNLFLLPILGLHLLLIIIYWVNLFVLHHSQFILTKKFRWWCSVKELSSCLVTSGPRLQLYYKSYVLLEVLIGLPRRKLVHRLWSLAIYLVNIFWIIYIFAAWANVTYCSLTHLWFCFLS